MKKREQTELDTILNYEKPEMTSYTLKQIREAIGPAVANSGIPRYNEDNDWVDGDSD